MDEQTTHDIILDLLPSYIEGLTHERTNEWIQDHLRTCPQCDRAYKNMKTDNAITKAPSRQIDYLKTIRIKTTRNLVITIIATCLVIGSLFAIKTYGIGSMIPPKDLINTITYNQGTIKLYSQDLKEGEGIGRIRWKKEQNILKATLFETPNGEKNFQASFEADDIDQVWINGLIEWDQGHPIKKSIARLYNMRSKSGSDQNDVKRLITYGTSIASCTTRFKNGVLFVDIESLDPENDLQSFDPSLTISRLSMRLLALVQDVKEIRWSYEGDDLGIFKKSDFDSIKEAYLHPIILQNWMEKEASSTSSTTIILNYKDLRDAQFTEFIIWHEGKKVYMNGMPNAPLSSLQTNLNEGEYEAEVKVKLDGNTLKSGLIRFKYSNKWQPIEFVIEKEKDGLNVEVIQS